MELNITNPHDIYVGDFKRMVDLQGLEVFEKSQVDQFLNQMGDMLEKSEYSELTDEEKQKIELIKAEVSYFNKWIVVGENFQKALKFTRPIQVEWDKDDICKGIYKETDLNKKLDRIGKEVTRKV
jgi:cell division septum initiation protein DivIVA